MFEEGREESKYVELGKAIEEAMIYFSLGQPNNNGKIEFYILTTKELVDWYREQQKEGNK